MSLLKFLFLRPRGCDVFYNAQLRTTDLEQALDFYTNTLGYKRSFRYEDFYAGIDVEGHILIENYRAAKMRPVSSGATWSRYWLNTIST